MDGTQLIILGGAGLLAVVIVVIGIISARSEHNLMQDRLMRLETESHDLYQPLDLPDETETAAKEERGGKMLERANEIIGRGKWGKSWRQKLARADLKLTVAEFAAAIFASTIIGFAGGYFVLFQGDIVMSIVAGFIGFFVPRIYVARTISKRLINFETQLPDTLSLWVNALRSGYSVLQSMEAIARDAPEPTATEFRRVVQEVALGIDMADALDHLIERVESEDLDLVITAVNIQREVGGNLAEILEVIGTTIRERIKLKGEIRVLTSQGRITGYLISFLPIGLAVFLNTINPGYMGPMFENRLCGWPMLGAGLALIGIGTAIIQKIIDIDI